MGRTLDALLGRDLKISKIKTLAKLAIARVAILKNQRQVRCSQARSDVKELLQLGHQQRALLRVEHVMKEQNMFDVFMMIEHYCNLLLERVKLIVCANFRHAANCQSSTSIRRITCKAENLQALEYRYGTGQRHSNAQVSDYMSI